MPGGGANPGNILDFENDFPGTKVIRLEQNYRSLGNILEAANGVIRNNRKRMEKSLWTSEGMGPDVKIMRAPNGEEEAKLVAGKILNLINSKSLSYDDFAIIYRANIFSRPFEAALRRNRIPYSVIGGTSYFDRKEIKDLASYLKIILNQYDDISLLRIANLPRRGIGNTHHLADCRIMQDKRSYLFLKHSGGQTISTVFPDRRQEMI